MTDKPKIARAKVSTAAQAQPAPAPTGPTPAPATAPPAEPATSASEGPVLAEPAAPSSVAIGAVVDGNKIRMLTGQEGPKISRVRGMELEVGADLGAAEANRLLDADFAERI